MPLAGGRLVPLLARHSPAAATELERRLGQGDCVHDAVACLDPRVVTEQEISRFGDPRRILFDVKLPRRPARRRAAPRRSGRDAVGCGP